jgi:hypothetical protein
MTTLNPNRPLVYTRATHTVLALLPAASKRLIKEEALRAQRILSSLGEPMPSLRALEATVLEAIDDTSRHLTADDEDFERYQWMYIVREHEAYVRLFEDCVKAVLDKFKKRGLTPTFPTVFEVVQLGLEDLDRDEVTDTPRSTNLDRFEHVVLPLVMRRAALAFPTLFKNGNNT